MFTQFSKYGQGWVFGNTAGWFVSDRGLYRPLTGVGVGGLSPCHHQDDLQVCFKGRSEYGRDLYLTQKCVEDENARESYNHSTLSQYSCHALHSGYYSVFRSFPEFISLASCYV